MEYTVVICNNITREIRSIPYNLNTEKLIAKVKRVFSKWLRDDNEQKESFQFEFVYEKDGKEITETFPNIHALIYRIKTF